MQINEQNVSIAVPTEVRAESFGISNEDFPHIAKILSAYVYKDKPRAVIREYVANAVDIHKTTGKADIPVKVTIPTNNALTFAVRDYGTGLSEEQIFTYYIWYGKSTKRDSNQDEGYFGIGCKAGFAYTSSFTITSWHEGIKASYLAFADDTGAGKLTKLFAQPSDEPSGIEIQIPIRPQDVHQFNQTATDLFQFFDFPLDLNVTIPKIKKQFTGVDWYIYTSADRYRQANSYIRCGQTTYPLDVTIVSNHVNSKITQNTYQGQQTTTTQLSQWEIYNRFQVFNKLNFVLEVPIGQVALVASREGLSYTEKTTSYLFNRLMAVYDEMAATIAEGIQNETSYMGAVNKYTSIRSLLGTRFDTLIKNTWCGLSLDRINYKGTVTLYCGRLYNQRLSSITELSYRSISAASLAKSVLYVNDHVSSYRERILKHIKTLPNIEHVYVIKATKAGTGQECLDVFLNSQPEFKHIPCVLLSTIPIDKQQRTSESSQSRGQSIRAPAYIWNANGNSQPNAYIGAASYWEPTTIDYGLTNGLYVVLDRFATEYSTSNLRIISEAYSKIHSQELIIYGIKKADVIKLGDNWQPLSSIVSDLSRQYYVKHKNAIARWAVNSYLDEQYDVLQQIVSNSETFNKLQQTININKTDSLYRLHKLNKLRYVDRYCTKAKQDSQTVNRLMHLSRIANDCYEHVDDYIKDSINVNLVSLIKNQYPLLPYIAFRGSEKETVTKLVIDYMTTIHNMEIKNDKANS